MGDLVLYFEIGLLLFQVIPLAYAFSFFPCAYSKWAWFFISLPLVFIVSHRITIICWICTQEVLPIMFYPMSDVVFSFLISLGLLVSLFYIKKMFIRIHKLFNAEHKLAVKLEQQVAERTEQLQATYTKMLRAKKQWEKTFDTLPDLVTILDTEHRIVRANKAFAAALGYTPAQIIGKHCYKLVHGTEHPPALCPAVLTMRDLTSSTTEMRMAKLNGDFVVSTHPILTSENILVGCIHVARDITEFTKVQAELEENTARLHLLEIAKTEDMLNSTRALNAGIAHELRTPMQAILNSLEFIQEGVKIISGEGSDMIDSIDVGELKTLIQDAEGRVNYSMKILDSLSAYAKAGTSKTVHLINVVDEVELVMKTLKLTDKFKSLPFDKFVMRCSCDNGCSIEINKADFMQALINLCTNAVEAISHHDPLVEIFIKCLDEGSVEIHIIDNGSGVPESVGNNLFEPYFSTKALRPEGRSNQGLGLSIVRNIVLTYSGKLSYESQPGHTDFCISFPCISQGVEDF